MRYHLFTGATGLLGHYLLYDAARLGVPLAVVARGNRMATARQRIDDSLTRWENRIGRSLPRPVILEGDLKKPDLGLNTNQRQWIRDNCDSVIHNAASLSFLAESEQDEPYLSNVGGTENLMQLCRSTGIRQFHHVSTAYICGLRTGRILETEVDVGQTPGNDYEKSKLTAEKMVASAEFLDQVTVHRPGIILGDSLTGYTSTFHGFYVPLKIAHAFSQAVALTGAGPAGGILSLFGMTGAERKNFVPVDWVSSAMMKIIADPKLHGERYHLTPNEATPLSTIVEVIGECMAAAKPSRQRNQASLEYLAETLESQMQAYKAYWRDDPVFDRTRMLAACGSLRCPDVDRAMLRRMSAFAIQAGFGWPREKSLHAVNDAVAKFTAATMPRQDEEESINLDITGHGGGIWNIRVRDSSVAVHDLPDLCRKRRIRMNARTWSKLLEHELDAETAILTGRVLLEGIDSPRIFHDLMKWLNKQSSDRRLVAGTSVN